MRIASKWVANGFSSRTVIAWMFRFLLVLCSFNAWQPALAQATWSNVAVSPASGTANAQGVLEVVFTGSVASTRSVDAIEWVDVLRVGTSTVLATESYTVNYDQFERPVNETRSMYIPLSLSVGTHQLVLRTKQAIGYSVESQAFTVTVSSAAPAQVNGATYVSQSVPTVVNPGQSFNVSITMRNSGTKTWAPGGTQPHGLGAHNPMDNTTWRAQNRVTLSSSVAPGGSATFNFVATAPSTPGTYNFQWRMVQDWVEWFGDTSPNVQIQVVALPTITVSPTPLNLVVGQTTQVSWSTTNATSVSRSCTASGTGYKATIGLTANGSRSETGSSAWVGYPSTCTWTATGAGGSTSIVQTMTTSNATPAPTLSVSPNPLNLVTGQSVNVNWSTTNATSVTRSCTASGTGYSGTVSLATSGSRSETGNAAWVGYPSTCTWTASGPGGNKTVTQTMTTANPPTITVSPTPLNLVVGQSKQVSWNTTNATSVSRSCTASGTGYNATIGLAANSSRSETGSSAWVGYPSTCTWTATGAGGSTSIVQTMTTSSSTPAPTLSVSPIPLNLVVGQSERVDWSTTNATSVSRSCTASGTGYSGTVSLSASSFRLETGSAAWVGYPSTCTWTATGAGGSTSVVQTMTTSSSTPAPSLNVSPNPLNLVVGQATQVNWSTTNASSVSRSCTASGTGYSATVSLGTSGSRNETGNSAWVGYPSTCTWTASGAGGSTTVTQTMTTTSGAVSETCLSQTPPSGTYTANINGGAVWGNNATGYTTDSSMPDALVHAGLLAPGASGKIIVTPLDTQSSFTGTTANGVTTNSYASPWCAMKLSLDGSSPTPTPTASITSPAQYSYFVATGATVAVQVQGSATAVGGSAITKLELLDGTTVLDTVLSTATYSKTLQLAPKLYGLRLRATNAAGGVGTSDTINFDVQAAKSGNSAQMVGQTVPIDMRAGQPYKVTVRMLNNGSTTWSESTGHRLGAQNPQDNRTFGGRAYLSSNVATGQTGVFEFEVTAPSTPGTYNFQWQMVQEGASWFGSLTQNVPITVTTGAGPSATLSAQPSNVRVTGTQTQSVTFTGTGARSGGSISKLELFQNSGRGYGAVPVHTMSGGASTVNYSHMLNLPAGVYAFKLRATDSAGVATDSAQVQVNITNSSLLGKVHGIRTNAAGNPELYGWVCQPGSASALAYKVLLDAPTFEAGGVLLTQGVANIATEPDNASVQSECATPGTAHHFVVDLSPHIAAYAQRALYVYAETAGATAKITLPCADNNCTMPGTLRVVMASPKPGDPHEASNPVFLRMQLTNYSGTYDETSFNIEGEWIPAITDTPGFYAASKAGLSARTAPYTVYAKVRKGNTTLYSMPVQFTVHAAGTVVATVTSPTSGATLTAGTAQVLSASTQGTVQSVKFYANGNSIGNATNTGSAWQMSWTPTAAGSVALTARAYDGSGTQIGVSTAVNVTVNGGSGTSATPVAINVEIPQLDAANDSAFSLPGKLVATPNGTAAYTIPLMLPPGTAGMVPSLSLVYDSAGTNGSAGLGWNLAGMSSIERCGRTLDPDGATGSVRFDSNIGGNSSELTDRLCIDGRRLILVNGDDSHTAYWATGAEYRTEPESFTRVTTVMNGNERTFKVETRDGRTAYYGDTTDSYIQALNRVGIDEQAYRWRLSRVTDRSGNYISYLYSENGSTGENTPLEIRWGGNTAAGKPHYAAVRLSFEARPDVRKAYVGGAPNFQATRLKEVASYVGIAANGTGGTLAQRYVLAYETSASSGRSLLKSMQPCDGTACLPATSFDYGTPSGATPGFVSLGGARTGPNLYALGNNGNGSGYAALPMDEIIVGDFNGDGKADILERYRVTANNNQQRLYESNADGMGWTEKQPFINILNKLAVMEAGDFDGDGRVDLLVANWTLGSAPTNWRLCLGRNFTDGTFKCGNSVSFPADSWFELQPPLPKRLVRDLDGDGKDDLLLRGGKATNTQFKLYKCMSTGTAFGTCTDVTGSYLENAFGDQEDGRPSAGTSEDDVDGDGVSDRIDLGRCVRGIGDSNGDGEPDWFCGAGYGADGTGEDSYIRVSNLPVPGVQALWGEWDTSTNRQNAFLPPPPTGSLTGDLNGDGYSDVVVGAVTVGGTTISTLAPRSRICLSKGNDEADCGSLPASNTPDRDHLVVTVADFDGDGMLDVLRPTNDIYNEDNITGYQLCNIGYSGERHDCRSWSGPTFYGYSTSKMLGGSKGLPFNDRNYARNRSMFLGDFDGDGKPDIASYMQGSSWEIFGSTDLAKAGEALDKLVQVTNGYGHVEKAEYAKGNSAQAYSHSVVPYSGTTFTQQGKRVQPGQLVRAIHRSNGQGGWLDTEYAYRGNAYDPRRRVSLGFAQVEARDLQNAITTTTWYYQKFPHVGTPQYVRSVDRDGTKLLESETTVSERYVLQANKTTSTVFPYVYSEVLRRKDLNGAFLERTQVMNTIDDWGNVTLATKSSFASDTATSAVGITNLERVYDNFAESWRIGELRKNIDSRSMGDSSITRTTAYTYDTNGLLYTETVEPGNIALSVGTTYHRTGNKFGLVNQTVIKWNDPNQGMRERTVSDIAYTDDGRFVNTRKNALSHQETLQFDARTGLMTQLTDANGLITSAAYDGFGRQLRATAADGTEAWTYYKGCNVACPAHAASVVIQDFKRGTERVDVPKLEFMNKAGQSVRSMSWGFDGKKVVTDTEYDAQGRAWRIWQPAAVTDSEAMSGAVPPSAALDKELSYDDLGRVTSVNTKDEANDTLTSTIAYNGLTVTSTNAKAQKKIETRDVWGRLKETFDALNYKTTYTYDAFGNLRTTKDAKANVITVTYDDLGRKTQLQDPDLGLIEYAVDPLGQVWRQITPNQRDQGMAAIYSTRMKYDDLGRLIERVAEDHKAGWVYDKLTASSNCADTRSCGKLVQSYTLAGTNKDFRQEHTYDVRGRPEAVTTHQADATYVSRADYDAWGRISRERHQRGTGAERVFDRRYNGYGYLSRIERGSLALWQATSADAHGRITAASLGNGLQVTREYHPRTGRQSAGLVSKSGSTVLQEAYEYDALGNVSQRTQNWGATEFIESFVYDELNRLKTSTITGQTPQGFEYNEIGNLISKTGVGTYTYPPSGATSVRPHAVKSITAGAFTYDANGNMLTAPGRATPWTWTSFDMPIRATKGSAYSDFVYGPDHQRLRQTRSDGKVIYYAGAMETEAQGTTPTAIKTYWPLGLGVEIESGATTSLNWTHQDRLGSVVAITDETGTAKEQLAYDAWGSRRNLSTLGTPSTSANVDKYPGYTGHEMLDPLGLVHMNGRIYDPLVARFTSGDPLIQDPSYSQSFNRYSYVWNNPTNLVDPSGFATTDAAPQTTTTSECGLACQQQQEANRRAQECAGLPTCFYSGPGLTQAQRREIPDYSADGGATYSRVRFSSVSGPALDGSSVQKITDTWKRDSKDYGTPAEVMWGFITFNPIEQIARDMGATQQQAYWIGVAGMMVGNPRQAFTYTAIGSTGVIGETALKALGGTSQKLFSTSLGSRYVDQFVNGIAHESKVGYTSLTRNIRRQIAKDIELIQTRQINGSTWHFFPSPVTGRGGPSQPLLKMLQQNGINYKIH